MPHKDLERRREYRREQYKLHPGRQAAANRKWRETEGGKAYQKRQLQKMQKVRSHLKQRYGLTVAEWDAKLIAQAGRCAICTEPMQRPCVDHDHDTGAVRDLLCHQCNIAVSWAEGNEGLLDKARAYVARWRADGA